MDLRSKNYLILILISSSLISQYELTCEAADMSELQETYVWLEQECQKQINGCRIEANDGTKLYTPDGIGNYRALWTRDFCYMIEGAPGIISWPEVEACIDYLIRHVNEKGIVPDRVAAEGAPTYNVLGPEPPTDNAQFLVKLVGYWYPATQDREKLKSYLPRLHKALASLPRDPNTGLVWIDPATPHSPYGFTDTIAKTGGLFFSSVLLWEAEQVLADLYDAAGEPDQAAAARNRAETVHKALETLWDAQAGCYLAASVDCKQPDVWGNAYAIACGCLQGDRAKQVAKWLMDQKEAVVMRGQVRHIPAPGAWQKTLMEVKPGTYQNGAYWATASGWLATAFQVLDQEEADRLILDCIADMKANGVYECINAGGYTKVKEYVASVTLPMQYLRKRLGKP